MQAYEDLELPDPPPPFTEHFNAAEAARRAGDWSAAAGHNAAAGRALRSLKGVAHDFYVQRMVLQASRISESRVATRREDGTGAAFTSAMAGAALRAPQRDHLRLAARLALPVAMVLVIAVVLAVHIS
ncbi:hypothetical protein [Streptacidiphilus sp. MAP5-52]|uniref:hypothetical protein n=1 Tax=Streptacidiphilus sp. MAP5-52 TaxID=3156267 RepID=UPI003518D98E